MLTQSKTNNLTGILVTLFALAILAIPQIGPAEEINGEEIFNSRCKGCHPLGGGSIAPDIARITDSTSMEYFVAYTLDPAANEDSDEHMHDDSFSMAMPPMSLSEDQVVAVFEFLGGLAASSNGDEIDSSRGEQLYELKCAGCHTIGGGPGEGPDLYEITSIRDREWLVQFLLDTAAAHISGGTLTPEEIEMYGRPMPEIGLNRQDAEAIVDYLDVAEHTPETSETDGDPGKELYDTKCGTCHGLGSPGIAPDLLGINDIRDHDWLVAYIINPQALIDAGDELAIQLLEENNNMPMPSVGVDEADTELILEYITGAVGGGGGSIGKPVPETVIGEGEADAVLDYIFGEQRLDEPKEAALKQPSTWANMQPGTRLFVLSAGIIFLLVLLGIGLRTAAHKGPI